MFHYPPLQMVYTHIKLAINKSECIKSKQLKLPANHHLHVLLTLQHGLKSVDLCMNVRALGSIKRMCDGAEHHLLFLIL